MASDKALASAPAAAYVGLGSNLDDPQAQVRRALAALDALPATRLVATSPLYATAPVGPQDQPDYVNAVVALRTGLSAPELLAGLQRLEQAAGRQRPYRHAPRTLDLDLLRYGDGRIDSAALCVPHPRMLQRAFVLRPLAEIAPQLVTPAALAAVAGQGIERLEGA